MSLMRGDSPSTFAVPEMGRERRLAAKERAAAKARSADQRSANAEAHAARDGSGPASSKQPDKQGGLAAPAPANLKAEDDEPASAAGRQLWVGPGFGTFCNTQSCPGRAASFMTWHACRSERRDECTVA